MFPAPFQKLDKLESPGEKSGYFSLLGQTKINILEKETFKLQVAGKQLVTLQIVHSTFNTYTFEFHQSKKIFHISTSHLANTSS